MEGNVILCDRIIDAHLYLFCIEYLGPERCAGDVDCVPFE